MKYMILLLVIVLLLAGCGTETPPAQSESQPETTEQVTEPDKAQFAVQICGEPKTGEMVLATPSMLNSEIVYRWYVDGQLLPAAMGDTLTIPFSAVDKKLTVTASLDGHTVESAPVTVVRSQPERISMAAVAHDVKLYGRCSLGLGLNIDFSASGFEMNVDSTGNPMTIEYIAGHDLYMAVYVDGKQWDRPLLTAGAGTLTVPLSKGQHTVMVLRETEVQTNGNTLQLLCFNFDGVILEKPADRPLYIEFIGDSISCGDGSLGTYTAGQKWSLEDHSATNSFAYLTAQKLGADWSVFARGGIGLVKPAGEYTAGQMFPYMNLYRDKESKYIPARIPDVVVVELGANDDKNDTEAFVAAYTQLVAQIRALYGPEVKIVWTGKNHNQYSSAQYVAGQLEDPNMFAFPFQYGGSGSAALATQNAGHPNADEHKAYTEALTGFLRKHVLNKEESQ
jgi:predicted small lipoprotein YifL